MKLLRTTITNVSEDAKRLSGFVRYDDGAVDEYWFEYPALFEISESGNPWLAALLPMAATIGEDLSISLPVDKRLLDGANDILRFWNAFDVGTSIIKINAAGGLETPDLRPEATASFFSTGVDAFYTVYDVPRAKYKILIHGFDIAIYKENEFKLHCDRIGRVVDELDQTMIPVRTNIRNTKWQQTRWQRVSHGASLAAIGLMFEKYFSEIFIPSSTSNFKNLGIWGSHPLTDPLYSTSRTNIITNGDGLNRYEKLKSLISHDLVLDNLHVCIRGKDGSGQDEVNCSYCEKCYRTMIALDLLGVLEKCKLFDLKKYHHEDVYKIFVTNQDSICMYRTMAKLAKQQGKHKLAVGIENCIQRSKRVDCLSVLDNVPLLWKVSHKLMDNSIY